MVPLDNVVEVFALSDHDLGAVLPIVVLDPRVVCAALSMLTILGRRLFLTARVEEALRRTTIAFGGQQEVDGVALLINRAIPIPVLAADLDVRFVQSPALPTAPMPRLRLRLRKASPSTGTSLISQR